MSANRALCALLLGFGLANWAYADRITGTVIGVADGDTITLLDLRHQQHKVRLAGIDAPEKRQDFGQRSKENLSVMAYRKEATVEGKKVDRYGRFVGKVVVDGVDLNLRQIEAGLAWHYKAYEREQSAGDRVAYGTAENRAKELKRGLWSVPGALPPWEFRQGATGSPASLASTVGAVIE